MKIIILGAGRVGQAVADSLVIERNDITVIDTNRELLRELESRYDLRGVAGNGIDPAVLAEAGAEDTELLIACASNDETNLVCCKVAQLVFRIPTRIARVRSNAWVDDARLCGSEGFDVSHVLRPEASLTRYLSRLVEFPGALQVREFVHGRAMLVSVRARATAPMVGKTIATIRAELPELPMRIVAIYRRYADEPDRFIHSNGDTRIAPEDEVFILAAAEDISHILSLLNKPVQAPQPSVRRIMIVDGGDVALHLAQTLTQKRKGYYRIKVVERSETMSTELSGQMPSDVLVFRAEGTDESFLEEESIEEVDLLLALSQDDENNIMTCLLAKRMGAKRVLALINQRSYADLMHGTQIDIALTPSQAMLGELLTYVRHGDVQAVHSLRRGVAEALEIVVRGNAKTCSAVGKTVGKLKLPRDVHLGLIVRGLEELQPPAPASAGDGAGDSANDGNRNGPDAATGSLATALAATALAESHTLQNLAQPSALAAPAAEEVEQRASTSSETAPGSDDDGDAQIYKTEDGVQVIFPNKDTVIQTNDHIVFFLPHKRLVREVEKAFSVKPTFF